MILSCYKCGVFTICFLIFITKVAVHSALVSETTLNKDLLIEDHSFHKSCVVDDDCRGNKQYCNTAIRLCECQEFYEYRIDTSNCSPCPEEGEECMGCCSHSYSNLRCYQNVCTRCDDDDYECDNAQSVFMNASQIALVAALIMGAAALATLLYRICTKPSYFGSRRIRSNRNAEATESDLQRVTNRSSLTSLQIRVISRLRDRPPKYETQHNYDMRLQRQESEIQRTPESNVESNTITCLRAAEHAPPPYDGSKESVNESPPPYSDTGHGHSLPDIIIGNSPMTSQIGGSTSQSNENCSISIISNASPERDILNKSQSDNKEDKSIHM